MTGDQDDLDEDENGEETNDLVIEEVPENFTLPTQENFGKRANGTRQGGNRKGK